MNTGDDSCPDRLEALLQVRSFSQLTLRGVMKKYAQQYDYTLQTLKEVPTTLGAHTIRQIRSASTLCVCTRWG
jgi:hypothetical protein